MSIMRRIGRPSESPGLTRLGPAILVLLGLLLAVLQLPAPSAHAAGPAYDGPVTGATGPAFFGPAPNPFPYCENPTYFDPLPENVDPQGRIDVTGSPNASVTTNGITLDFTLTAEGAPGTQYPGFFPGGNEGGPGDQPKGVEMASDDAATIDLSQPLFYTQWIFTDVDRANEGFFVTPSWTGNPGQVAVFGGDANFTLSDTTTTTAAFNDTDTQSQDSEAIEGRVQVDFLGAVDAIDLLRDTGNGQSGFAIAGGCEPIGVSKEVTSGPTWNGTGFDVTYTIRVRNNLPSTATITADVDAAIAASAIGFKTGDPVGIDMTDVTLEDLLADTAFSAVNVIDLDNPSMNIATNDMYDGITDIALIPAGETIAPESNEEFVLQLEYIPEAGGLLGPTCSESYVLENQATAGGNADGVDVVDLSDSGADPDPGSVNVGGDVNDPTIVTFECPPAADANIEIVKTVLAGPMASCPAFANGVAGVGTPLDVEIGDTVTYCISVRNPSTVDVTNVVVTDPQAPASFNGAVGTLAADGGEDTVQFDLAVTDATPTTNTASANGQGPNGALPEVMDPAEINPSAPAEPRLEIVKTVLAGPMATCPSFADGVAGVGTPLDVEIGDTVTYCISVRNPSTVDVTNVVVTDPQAPASFDGAVGTLTPGTSNTVQFDLPVTGDTPATNTASANGEGPGGPVPEVTDVAEINPAQPPAAISLVKTVVADGVECANAVEGTDEFVLGVTGDAITWCFVVTNSGQVPLTNVLFADAPAGIADRNLLDGVIPPVLSIGESISFSLAGTIPEDGVDNVANVSADPSDDAGVAIPDAGEVTDENAAAINETSIELLKKVVQGPNGDCAVAEDLITVNQGTDVTYCFTVTNTGGVHVLVTEVNDDTLSMAVALPTAEQIIAPGTSVTVSMEAVATGDIVNVASIDGVPVLPGGEPFPDPPPLNPEDPAEVVTLLSDISIVKTVGSTTAQVNGVLPYQLDVSNAGPDPAADAVVIDTLPAGLQFETPASLDGWTCELLSSSQMSCERAEPLPVDQTESLIYTVRVTAAAPLGEDIVNTATVTSSTPDADPTNNDDDEPVQRIPPFSFTPDAAPPIVTITNPPPSPVSPTPSPSPVLAITGSQSWLMVFMSLSMAMSGGVLWISSRRRFAEENGASE